MKPFFSLLALAAAVIPAPAQQEMQMTITETGEVNELPRWLVEFSNLPRDVRSQYINTFNRAKQAYSDGQWIDCIALLVECEVIQRGNPGVWNLRACCLMEQKNFEEAAAELERVLQAQPDDHVALMNLANMHMACGRYAKSLELLAGLREELPYETPEEVFNVLNFRALLCHLKLGQEKEAQALVKHLSPISDTPLYYYSRAAFALVRRDLKDAAYCQQVAARIFAKNNATEPYKRALKLSGL